MKAYGAEKKRWDLDTGLPHHKNGTRRARQEGDRLCREAQTGGIAMSGVKIRRAKGQRDLDSIAALDRLLFPLDYKVDVSTGTWWLAYDEDGCVVGYGGAANRGAYVFLRRAGVVPRMSGQGVHRRLIQVRVAWARAQGSPQVLTYTAYNGLRSANNLLACGFKLYTPSEPYGFKDSLYMRLRLRDKEET